MITIVLKNAQVTQADNTSILMTTAAQSSHTKSKLYLNKTKKSFKLITIRSNTVSI